MLPSFPSPCSSKVGGGSSLSPHVGLAQELQLKPGSLLVFLEPLHWYPWVLFSLSPALELGRVLVNAVNSFIEEQPSAKSPARARDSPTPLIHFSSVGSVWHEKYLIQVWANTSGKPDERECVCTCTCVCIAVCALQPLLTLPLYPSKGFSPGPQVPTMNFLALAIGSL